MRFSLNTTHEGIKSEVLSAFVLFLSLLLLSPEIMSQSSGERPHVGLVLSGGGARGMAHVGILKVMEESGLRPDFITGVSMGSLVGGMYSIGYKADSLEKLFKIVNWDLILSNKIPENKVIFPEKEHFLNSVISLPISFKKVSLPSGLINGQQVESMLSFYAWPAADINDFSKLPIPFMCLATNMVTCKQVDLTDGYLSDAIRASMAVPSIFTPIKIDSLLLLDGGIVRNFAATEVIKMGADIIIGSYTGRHLFNEEELQSVAGIMLQLSSFTGLNDFGEQRKLVDLLIEPDVNNFPATGFKNAESIIQEGYRAALPYKEYFRKIADSLNTLGPQKPVENIMDKKYYTFDRIEINGNKIYSDDQILGVLEIEPGDKVDRFIITEKIELLYGKVWFEKVKYRFVSRNDSLILAIDCTEKPKAILYGSVHYDESLKSGLIIDISAKNILTRRSVIDFHSLIGQYYRLKLEYLQYIDRNQKYGLSASFNTDKTLLPVMESAGETGKIISRNIYHGLAVNRRLGLNNMMSISASLDMLYLIPGNQPINQFKKLSYNYLTTNFEYNVNTLDIKHFPDKGTILNLYAGTSKLLSSAIRTDSSKTFYEANSSNFSFDRFYTFHGNFRHYFSSGNKVTFAVEGDALFITNSDSLSSQNNFFLLGGIHSVSRRSIPMIGFHTNEIAVKKLAGIGGEIDAEIFQNLHLSFMANIFVCQEKDRDKGFSFLTGYGIGAGYMSVIGPLRVGLMHGKYSKEKYLKQIKGYISFGYNF
jgi:NTE family protein